MKVLLRVIVFQALWFLFIYLSNYSIQYLTPICALIAVFIDWKLSNSRIELKNFALFICFLLITGMIIDTTLQKLGFIGFKSPSFEILSPFYMWSIWIIFIPYYDFAFTKFYNSKFIGFIFALIGAPLAYNGGSKIGTMTLNSNSFVFIGIFWAIFFPISLYLYPKLSKPLQNSGKN